MANGSSARPTPSGTRDVLPDEMGELRAMTGAMLATLSSRGYGEVRTPSVEYERSMPGSDLGPEPAYRLVDEHGESLVLRSDMTLPIARIATTRYSDVDGPLRFCYLARSWRRVKPLSGEPREILQLGGELIGAEAVDAAAEVLGLVGELLESTGLAEWRIAIGHSDLAGEMLDRAGVQGTERAAALAALDSGRLSQLGSLPAGDPGAQGGFGLPEALVRRVPAAGGGVQRLGEMAAGGPASIGELHRTIEALPAAVRDRVIADFSLRPRLGYYEGIVFEVYDPAVGSPLGGGGRYDGLLAELGRKATAVGFALDTDLVHAAVAGEARGEGRVG